MEYSNGLLLTPFESRFESKSSDNIKVENGFVTGIKKGKAQIKIIYDNLVSEKEIEIIE